MTVDDARAIAFDQADAVEGAHHGHPDFRVGKSVFATLWPTQNRSVLRLPEPLAESLEQQNPETFKIVSRSGGQGWLSVQLETVDPEEFRSLMEVAHQHLVAGKSAKK
ncbi:MAG TPA: MmcQ/YjbR family DNA-binding protein [Fimbriimonadaceae bacterium]|nr:MmcQ/YjbR family DNA-binding protein [Fimbriimonadaceae bacterium]